MSSRLKLSLFLLLIAGAPLLALEDMTVLETMSIGHAQGMESSPDGSLLYVQHSEPTLGVAVVDTATMSIVADIPFESGYLMDISPAGDRLYLAGSGELEVLDLVNHVRLAPITFSAGSGGLTGVVVSPDGTLAYASDRGTSPGYVHVFDLVNHVYLESFVADPWGWPFVMGLDISPDGQRLYVSSRKYSHVTVVDTTTKTVIATIPVGVGGGNILSNMTISPDGKRGYMTTVQSGKVAVSDTDPASLTYHQQIALITTVSNSLSRVGFSADGLHAIVGTGAWVPTPPFQMLIIDADPLSATDHQIVASVTVGPQPWSLVGGHVPGLLAYVSSWDIWTDGGGALLVVGSVPVDMYACEGFHPPADSSPLKVKGKGRTIPLKANLTADGIPIGSDDPIAWPRLRVLYLDTGGDPMEVTGLALADGHGTADHRFVSADGLKWQYNLDTVNFVNPGKYRVELLSGNDGEYVIEPTCVVEYSIE